MKTTAKEWIEHFQSLKIDAFLTDTTVRAIQADAFRHAAELCRSMAKFMSNPDLADTYFCAAQRLDMEAAALENQK